MPSGSPAIVICRTSNKYYFIIMIIRSWNELWSSHCRPYRQSYLQPFGLTPWNEPITQHLHMSYCLFWSYRPPCQPVIQSGSFSYSLTSVFLQTTALFLISIGLLSLKFLNVYSSIVFNHPSFSHQTSTNLKTLIVLVILLKLVFLQPSTTFLPHLTPEIPFSSSLSTSVLLLTALIPPSLQTTKDQFRLRRISLSLDWIPSYRSLSNSHDHQK